MGKKVQMEIVAVLALISLFTHNHLFWIAGLLLALIDLPDFSSPISSIARSLEKLSGRDPPPRRGSGVGRCPEPEPKSIRGRGYLSMFELMLCSMLTVFPDYLFRRYVQGKRIGREINSLYGVV